MKTPLRQREDAVGAAVTRAFTAERHIGSYRLGMLVFMMLVLPFMPLDATVYNQRVAYGLLVVWVAYGIYMRYAEPYRQLPVRRTLALVTLADVVLTSLWLFVTGAMASPFMAVLLLSIAAVAWRHGRAATCLTTLSYCAFYIGGAAYHGQLSSPMLAVFKFMVLIGAGDLMAVLLATVGGVSPASAVTSAAGARSDPAADQESPSSSSASAADAPAEVGGEAVLKDGNEPVPLSPIVGSCRVLLVEDNADAAHFLALLLERWGHKVTLVHTGDQAIAAARATTPDLILLDIGLPGMSGYEVARTLRADPDFASTRLVAITGYGDHDDRQEAFEAGFDLHLVKPLGAEVLAQVLDTRPLRPR